MSTIAKKYIRGLTLAGCVTGGSKSYYQYDAHGNVVQLTDASGAVTQSYDYDAFGNQFSPSLTDSNLFRYSGEYFDEETEFYYLRARYYSPWVGRFVQEDTYWTTDNLMYGNEPTTLSRGRIDNSTEYYLPSTIAMLQNKNLYVYCLNEPIRYVDTSGLWTFQVSGEVSVFAGFSIGAGDGIVIDGEGNIGRICYFNRGMGMYGVSANLVWTYTTAPTIYDLNGAATSSGGSVNVTPAVSVGVEVGTFYDAQGNQQTSVSVSAGVGISFLPAECHVTASDAGVKPIEDSEWLYVVLYGMMKSQKAAINEALEIKREAEEDFRTHLIMLIALLR